MSAYAITSRMRAKQGMEEEFAELLVAYEKSCAGHPGLISHCLQRNIDDPREFLFHEIYDSKEHLIQHRAAPENKRWAPVRDAHIDERHVHTWELLNMEGPASLAWKKHDQTGPFRTGTVPEERS